MIAPIKDETMKTLSGKTVTMPKANQQQCFMVRQGRCDNMATWRMESQHLVLHFCDKCKEDDSLGGDGDTTWVKL